MKKLHGTALLLALPALVALTACGGGDTADDEGMTVDTTRISVSGVGFQTPESVLHDAEADVYLVSNINGAPTDVDGNGFISRIAPNGEVVSLKWIDGTAEGVTLNAPKGLAIKGDTLFVTDITAVRAFDRNTGEPLGSWSVEGATFLNDLAVDADGTLYVSDSGLNPDFSSSGTDAVYRFDDGAPVVVAEGAALGGPNGLATRGDEVIVVGFGGTAVRSLPAMGGEATVLRELAGGQLDGVVLLDDGSMLVSSWETSTVYRVPADAEADATAAVENVPSPADIGWDARRHRVLIPIFQENRVEIHPVSMGPWPLD